MNRAMSGVFIQQCHGGHGANHGSENLRGVCFSNRKTPLSRGKILDGQGLLDRRGATALETAVLIGVVVAALVVMSRYIRRGYLGYLYSNGSAHGQQFDPRESFQAVDTLHHFNQVVDTDIIGGQAAVTFYQSSGASGTPPSRALGVKTKVVNDWDFGRDAQFTVRK